MGIHLFRVSCSACSFKGTAREGASGSHYILPNGAEAELRMAPAWCAQCATTVDAEVLPSREALELELKELENGGTARDAFMVDAAGFSDPRVVLEFAIDSLRARLAWLALRTSPPRCLACGSHEIAYIPWDKAGEHRTMQHPLCGGLLRFESYAHGSPKLLTYSVDGKKLPE